eukprot:SAG22_NODE_4342_length_1297_cov_1.454925_2_plen_186_part_00
MTAQSAHSKEFQRMPPSTFAAPVVVLVALVVGALPPATTATVTSVAKNNCNKTLKATCGPKCIADPQCTFKCATCAGDHQQALQRAGCDESAIQAWCAAPSPPGPPPGSPAFSGSRIITTREEGTLLNQWAGKPVDHAWELCYTSFTMNKAKPAVFHQNCDQYNQTFVVATKVGQRARSRLVQQK